MERRQPTIPQETQGQSAPIQLPPTLGRISHSSIEDDISAEKKGQRIVWRLHLSQHRRES